MLAVQALRCQAASSVAETMGEIQKFAQAPFTLLELTGLLYTLLWHGMKVGFQ